MCKTQKFYICEHCQNLVGLIDDRGVPLLCCGSKMTQLLANTVEASAEKHLPAAHFEGQTLVVEVGSTHHPMTQEHHISFVYVESEAGGQRKCLALDQAPVAKFTFIEDKPRAVYAYCNLHGMWKIEV